MFRLLAPQSQEAPFTFHAGTTDAATFRALVDQLSGVGGFDMIMMSFGSGAKSAFSGAILMLKTIN